VQDIATSSYLAERGIHRPVYVHEAVHAMVARDLRLLAGSDLHNTLQEAIANYVQIVMFPESIPRGALERGFRQGVGEDRMFAPIETLFRRRATLQDYAQLATIIAYFIDVDPDRLIRIVDAQANGKTLADAVVGSGLTFDKLESDWVRWGREQFGADAENRDDHFNVPQEIKPVVYRSN
jgi:hypothetical protein